MPLGKSGGPTLGAHLPVAIWGTLVRRTELYKLRLAARSRLPPSSGLTVARQQVFDGQLVEARRSPCRPWVGCNEVPSQSAAWATRQEYVLVVCVTVKSIWKLRAIPDEQLTGTKFNSSGPCEVFEILNSEAV